MKKLIAIAAVAIAALALAGCMEGSNETKARNNDERTSADALVQLQQAQPTPNFEWSQLRQNLIEIQTAQANTIQTTTFFFNMGVQNPVFTCPSIGYPIPSTAQLTNPEQKVNDHALTLPQVEVTGIYSGDSTGTHVICVDPQGKGYDSYWEGFVQTVTGPAEWNAAKGSIVLTGAPTAEFSTSQ